MVLHDYHCSVHSYFEGWEPKCPIKGCQGEVTMVFLQPVSVKSDATKNADKTLRGLAEDFGMTDIKSTREGEHQTGYLSRNNQKLSAEEKALVENAGQVLTPEDRERLMATSPKEPRPGDAAVWGNAGGMDMKSVIGGKFRPVADEAVSVVPSSVQKFSTPKPSIVTQDHENLTIPR